MAERKERRCKILFVPEKLVFDLVVGASMYDVLSVPAFDKILPKDAKMLGVQYYFERRAFGFLVEHKSFDIVADCETIPGMDGPADATMWRSIDMKKFFNCERNHSD